MHNRLHARRPLVASILALMAVTVALAAPAAVAADEDTCTGHWPASVQGMPATYHSGARAGDYIWHNSNGWHLRVTHAGDGKRTFSGRIVSDAPLRVAPVRLEKGDTWALSDDHKTITYRFANYGHVDGLDFVTACADSLSFLGKMSGEKLPVGRIWIGRTGAHPLQNPFTILRVQ